MHTKILNGRKVFLMMNNTCLVMAGFISLLPFIYLISVSLSDSVAVAAGEVSLWPIGLNLKSYEYVLRKSDFLTSLLISVERVVLGTSINMLLVVLTAYPLSKETARFKQRTAYAWFFAFTMFFGGGLIPTFMVVRYMGLLNTIWALVVPGAVSVGNIILMLNFFRSLPVEMEEAAMTDGAGHMTILFRIFLPVSSPGLATVMLFIMVTHWNTWFDGIIYMNTPSKYPLQSYLQALVIMKVKEIMTAEDAEKLRFLSDKTMRASQIFIGMLPILLVYPFLQKYFTKGLVLGSVKG